MGTFSEFVAEVSLRGGDGARPDLFDWFLLAPRITWVVAVQRAVLASN